MTSKRGLYNPLNTEHPTSNTPHTTVQRAEKASLNQDVIIQYSDSELRKLHSAVFSEADFIYIDHESASTSTASVPH